MPIKDGDTVQVHYTGTLEDGSIFDSSKERDPLEFTVGSGMLIAGFEAAIIGKEEGDKVNTTIAPTEGYGERDEEQMFMVPISELPDHIPHEVGLQLQLSNEEGEMFVTIADINEEGMLLDANHPLAGKTLQFEIEIISVK